MPTLTLEPGNIIQAYYHHPERGPVKAQAYLISRVTAAFAIDGDTRFHRNPKEDKILLVGQEKDLTYTYELAGHQAVKTEVPIASGYVQPLPEELQLTPQERKEAIEKEQRRFAIEIIRTTDLEEISLATLNRIGVLLNANFKTIKKHFRNDEGEPLCNRSGKKGKYVTADARQVSCKRCQDLLAIKISSTNAFKAIWL